MRLLEWLFAIFFLGGSWETRRKHDLGPYYQSQIDELRRLYPREADEIILREHKRLGPRFSRALNAEAEKAMNRLAQWKRAAE